jgi:uncharacterized SAM-binding protein YcdF (DUF218 family)
MSTFFYLLKNLLLPPTLLFLLFVSIYVLLLKYGGTVRRPRRLLLSAILFYYSLGITPTADLICAPLETKYTPLISTQNIEGIKAIVVLGGGAQPAGRLWPFDQVSRPTAFRLLEAVRLFRSMDSPYIIVSTGKASPFLQNYTESQIMAEFLSTTGIPKELIIEESSSSNTYENAKYTVALLREKELGNGFLLVTSSIHMPRAMAVFLKLGANPIPAPADFRSSSGNYTALSFFPNVGNMDLSVSAIYEYLGLVWYWIKGYI